MTASLANAFLVINRFFYDFIHHGNSDGVFYRYPVACSVSIGILTDFKCLMPPIGSFGQQHIVRVDAHHDDIVHGSAFFDEAVVDDDKPRGGFRCPHQGLQVNSRVAPESLSVSRAAAGWLVAAVSAGRGAGSSVGAATGMDVGTAVCRSGCASCDGVGCTLDAAVGVAARSGCFSG